MMTQLGNDKLSCAVLVNSCDKYSETWIPFFTLLKKYWPDCEYPIYLNTENKKCSIPDISTINFKDIGGVERQAYKFAKRDKQQVCDSSIG